MVEPMIAQANTPTPAEFCVAWVHLWWTEWPTWWLCMTKAEWSGWWQAIGTVLAVVVAVGYPLWHERERQRRVRLAHLQTIATDIRIAERQASVYLSGRIKLPAYRVPLHGANTALPALLAEGNLATGQVTALVQFYVDATSFNFCLDIAQRLKESGGHWQEEVSRIRKKAQHLVPGGAMSRFDEAIRALQRAGVPQGSLQRIPFTVRVEGDDNEGE